MRKRTQARECALQILYHYEINPGPVEEVLENYWSLNPSYGPDVREYSEKLVRGVSDLFVKIDETITKYAENWHLKRMAVIDRNILRFATYELIYCADIPPKVTINEAVNIAKKYSQEDSGKFVNGILDRISHAEGTGKAANDEITESESPST